MFTKFAGNRGPGRTPLDWTTRLKLAAGAARGLAFLHGCNKSKLTHGHLTSSNIIVDAAGNACIADAGLLPFLPFHSPAPDNAYTPPELAATHHSHPHPHPHHQHPKLSQKADVYSFGVVLLEILTGKTVVAGDGERSLAKWVKKRQEEEQWRWEVFDFELWRYKEMEKEMKSLLQIALLCLAPLPTDRPNMSTVHKMVEDIRMKGGQKDHEVHSPPSSGYSSQSESTQNFTSS